LPLVNFFNSGVKAIMEKGEKFFLFPASPFPFCP
jgi:hypothetical protein